MMDLDLIIGDTNLHEIAMNPDIIQPPLRHTGQYATRAAKQLIEEPRCSDGIAYLGMFWRHSLCEGWLPSVTL